jgi:hypothetical protein
MKTLLGTVLTLALAAILGASPAFADRSNGLVIDTGSREIVEFTPVEGRPYSGPVAEFTGHLQGAGYEAVIDWGDGTTPDTVRSVEVGAGEYHVAGSHTYQQAGTRTVHVQLRATDTKYVVDEASAARTTVQDPGEPADVPDEVGLYADVVWSPDPPCAEQEITFDASGSYNRRAIRSYHWEFDTQNATGRPVVRDTATPRTAVKFPYTSTEQDIGTGEVLEYHISPATVTLTLTDEAGHTSTVRRTVTFADDGFKPTAAKPKPDCPGTAVAAAPPAADQPVAPVISAPAKVVSITPGVFSLQIACAIVADCNLIAKVYSPTKKLLAKGLALVTAGQTADVPLSLTARGKRYAGKRVRLRVGLRAADGLVTWVQSQRLRLP